MCGLAVISLRPVRRSRRLPTSVDTHVCSNTVCVFSGTVRGPTQKLRTTVTTIL